jgi:hypothetical protein
MDTHRPPHLDVIKRRKARRRLLAQVLQAKKKRNMKKKIMIMIMKKMIKPPHHPPMIWRVEKVMGMIHKINLMGVPLQVEGLLFNIYTKTQRKTGCFTCGENGHFRDNCPNTSEPKKRGEQRQGAYKYQDLGWFFKWTWTSKVTQPPLFISLFSVITQMTYGER